jgi:hypothetical protein
MLSTIALSLFTAAAATGKLLYHTGLLSVICQQSCLEWQGARVAATSIGCHLPTATVSCHFASRNAIPFCPQGTLDMCKKSSNAGESGQLPASVTLKMHKD